jgi:hypothetical protein
MKTRLALAFVVAGIAAGAAAASPAKPTYTYWGWRVISYPAGAQGYPFITDNLGGNGHPTRAPRAGYTLITDTLAPGGGQSVDLVATTAGFNWADAGIGAGVGAPLALIGGTLVLLRRRDLLPTHP